MIGITNNSPQQINAALIALKGEVKNEVKNEIINNIDNSVIGETYTAGDGIDITNAVISQTTDQLTFTGTQAQWEALTSAEKAKYGLVNITDGSGKGVYKNNNGTLELIAGRGDLTYPEGFVYQQLYFPAVTIGGKSYSAGWGKTPIELGMTPASGCKWEEFTKAFTDAGKQYLKIMSNASQSGHNAYHRHSINMLMFAEGSSNLGYSVGWGYRRYQPDEIKTDYEGDVNEQTVEVNASGMKIWKVVADT